MIKNRIREQIRKGELALPLNLPGYPLGLAELKELGVGYANCGPADEFLPGTDSRNQAQVIA